MSSADAHSEMSSSCRDSSFCLKFGWMNAVGIDLCSKTNKCDNSTRSSESSRATCVALGGDPALQNQICGGEVSEETVDSWLRGGNLTSGSSAYRFSFMPMWEFLTNVNFTEFREAAQMLRKAVEYSNCRINENPPVQAWDGSACQCVRKCANGGTLNPDTCTCKCKGNAKHGWTGPECEETYGSCQPGVGTGNRGAAQECPVRGSCSSWYDSHLCKPTEVCCATNIKTTCCPYGNSCKCSVDRCSCVPP